MAETNTPTITRETKPPKASKGKPQHYRPAPCSAEDLRKIVHYDPETGAFVWVKPGTRGRVGDPAGHHDRRGYLTIFFGARGYKAHRLAWLYVHGEWPPGDLDHIDGDRRNNRIANLRQATRSQNVANVGRRSSNRSGFKGVYRHRDRWQAQILSGSSRKRHLGTFDTAEEAHEAYKRAAAEIFGPFARFK